MGRSPPLKRYLAFVADLEPDLRELETRPEFTAQERSRWSKLRQRAENLAGRSRDSASLPAPVLDTADVSDLPPALLDELSGAHADPLEKQILAVFQACGGSADLDQILVGLFRKFEVVQKRRYIQNKLWRMVRKGQIHKTNNARGIFRTEATKTRQRKQGRRK